MGQTVDLDADTTVRFAEFFSDYAVRDGQVYKRSNEVGEPAAHLIVTSKGTAKAGAQSFDVVPVAPRDRRQLEGSVSAGAEGSEAGSLHGAGSFHEPGQWGVWAGVVLIGVGLAFVFYVVHMRFWVVPVRDERSGLVSLWIGGSCEPQPGRLRRAI